MAYFVTMRSAADIPEELPPSQERCLRAYWGMKPAIDRKYPPGHAVAFYDGELFSDAAESGELLATLRAAGKELEKVLVVEAGAEELTYLIFEFWEVPGDVPPGADPPA